MRLLKNITLQASQDTNLNEILSANEALTLLHYALNIAFVNPRITYANEDSVTLNSNLGFDSDNQISYRKLCENFDDLVLKVKQFKNTIGTTTENKALNRIEIEYYIGEGAAETAYRVKCKGTTGPIWAVDDIGSDANREVTIGFPNSIPWLTKSSIPNQKSPYNFPPAQGSTTIVSVETWYSNWLFTGALDKTYASIQQFRNSFDKLPIQGTKAVHDYLTHNSIFWPDPIQQANGWFPLYNGKVPVMSPPLQTPPNSIQLSQITASYLNKTDYGAVLLPEAQNCDNPQAPKKGLPPSSDDLQPSMLLGYLNSENYWQLNTIRSVNNNTVAYFFSKRGNLGKIASAESWTVNEIKNRMNGYRTGFYAMTAFRVKPNLDATSKGQCNTTDLCDQGNVCIHGVEYFLETEYNHFSLLPKAPNVLAPLFD